MLIDFSVGNFRSIKDLVSLSMLASKIKEPSKDEFVFEANKYRLIKSAVIYGANASGKSNVIKALGFMIGFVKNSSKDTQLDETINVVPFRLSSTSENEPSTFEVTFIKENTKYRYGFQVDSKRVRKEWLFSSKTSRESRLFLREDDDISVSDGFKEGRGLEKRTRPNALFLSVAGQFNVDIAKKIIEWFLNINVLSGLSDDGFLSYTLTKLSDPAIKEKVTSFLKIADVGIESIDLIHNDIDIKDLPADMPEDLKLQITRLSKGQPVKKFELTSFHPKFDENNNQIGYEGFDFLDDESDGTKKIFALSAPILNTLEAGKILVVDEFDSRLHAVLTKRLVSLFNSSESNCKGAQLIFATHDVGLLNKINFRRDQVWFIEKDDIGASDLFSLSDFKVRNDASYGKDYVQGRYGAIPFVGDFNEIFEGGRGNCSGKNEKDVKAEKY